MTGVGCVMQHGIALSGLRGDDYVFIFGMMAMYDMTILYGNFRFVLMHILVVFTD